MSQTLAYVRVSTLQQDVTNQRYEVLEYARRNGIQVDYFIEIEISSRRNQRERRIDELVSRAEKGDTVIVSELSRLGRSTGEIIDLVNMFVKREVSLIAIKQGIKISGALDMQSKVIVTVFGLLAELERDIIAQRTREALAAKKANGKRLGKPRGTIQKSKLDSERERITELLSYKVPRSAIARVVKCSRVYLSRYIATRNLG